MTVTPLAKHYLRALGLYDRLMAGEWPRDQAAVITERAEAVAARVEVEYKAMAASGGLKGLHRQYRRYRLDCKRKGKPAKRFWAVATDYKRDMIALIAREVRAQA